MLIITQWVDFMTKITQFSTIGALMAGLTEGWKTVNKTCCGTEFGLGCASGVGGELTIFEGKIYQATAEQPVTILHAPQVPFIQLTEFVPEASHSIQNIDEKNLEQQLLQCIDASNIWLAVTISAQFSSLVLRRPQPASSEQQDMEQMAASQQVSHYQQLNGTLIGFWTPALYGRISVPGFHFHFLDSQQQISGHVLTFSAEQAELSYQQKPTIEITNPSSEHYRQLAIDIDKLDNMISRIE
jgi:acetolactate decarboxylase